MGPGKILYSFFKSLQEVSEELKKDKDAAKKLDDKTEEARLLTTVTQ